MQTELFGDSLPADMTTFVGRRRELAEVRTSLRAVRLLTLTGVGGVGKTRLALQAARDRRNSQPDGAWLVELASVTDPQRVVDEVSAVVGLVRFPSDRRWEALMTHLRGKQILLVLDNCEHLREACAELVTRLLAELPGIRILATSRQPLGVVGEQIFAVPPLSTPQPSASAEPGALAHYDTVLLLEDRTRAVEPSFRVSARNAASVARLCRILDGIPLAIELAAARLRALSISDLVENLDHRFEVLTAGNRFAPPRQQTLLAAMDWSYDLCSEPERTLWTRLSVFSGGFELAAAEAVCAADGLPVERIEMLLVDLKDKSIVSQLSDESPQGHARYSVLETIRDYGRLRLTAEEWDRLQSRHLHWFTLLAEGADVNTPGDDEADWHQRVRLDTANIRHALDYCISRSEDQDSMLRFVASVCTPRCPCASMEEERRWLDQALAIGTTPSADRARALWSCAWLAGRQGDIATARRRVAECMQVAELIDDDVARTYAIQFEGATEMFAGNFVAARSRLAEAVEKHAARGDAFGSGISFIQLTMTQCFAGDDAAAASVAACRLNGSNAPAFQAYVTWLEAVRRFVRGDREGVAEKMSGALREVAGSTDEWLAPSCLETLAWVTVAEGDYVRGGQLFGTAEAMRRTFGCEISGLTLLARPHDEYLAMAKRGLGAAELAAEYNLGLALDYEQAVKFAAAGGSDVQGASGGEALRESESPLTPRESQVAALVAAGQSNREIAEKLVVSQRTAETHVEHILTKLGFTTRAQIVAWHAERTA